MKYFFYYLYNWRPDKAVMSWFRDNDRLSLDMFESDPPQLIRLTIPYYQSKWRVLRRLKRLMSKTNLAPLGIELLEEPWEYQTASELLILMEKQVADFWSPGGIMGYVSQGLHDQAAKAISKTDGNGANVGGVIMSINPNWPDNLVFERMEKVLKRGLTDVRRRKGQMPKHCPQCHDEDSNSDAREFCVSSDGRCEGCGYDIVEYQDIVHSSDSFYIMYAEIAAYEKETGNTVIKRVGIDGDES